MLVLTRKLQQEIKIGDQITVTILRVKGQTVRVGISAPRDVRVIRGELPPGANQAAGSAEEMAIEETSLIIAGEEPQADAADETACDRKPPTVSQAPAAPRLPQRSRFNRSGHPPLRLAMATASTTLAK